MNWPDSVGFPDNGIDRLHEILLDLYNKEPRQMAPGNRPTAKTLAQMHRDSQAEEIGAR